MIALVKEESKLDLEIGKKWVMKRIFIQEDYNRFAKLTQDDNPTHVDIKFASKTRWKRTLAHGMHLYSNICRMLSTVFPGPGMLQVKHDLMFPGPVFTDDEITFQLEVLEIMKDKKQARIRTSVYNSYRKPFNKGLDGETIVYLPDWDQGFPGIDESMIPHYHSEGKLLGKIKLNEQVQTSRIFTYDDLREYADLTGDQNPLFIDPGHAKQKGFEDCIIPGPLLSGMFSYLLGTKLPGRGTNWMKQKLYFPNPAYVGEEITAIVKVVRIRPGKKIVNLYDTCITKEGKVVCQAESTTLVLEML